MMGTRSGDIDPSILPLFSKQKAKVRLKLTI